MNKNIKNFIKLYLTVEQYCKTCEAVENCYIVAENGWGEVVVEFKGNATLNEMNNIFDKIYNFIKIFKFTVNEYNNTLGTIILTVDDIDEADYYSDAIRLVQMLSN